jgi:N-acetylglutamate synthase-like GNAT family acetyltransferase
MYVRDARNREEVWLLDHIESMGLDDTAFRSRDYVVAVDEESNAKAGFGRIRVHRDPERGRKQSGQGEGDGVCELTSIGVLDGWEGQGVGAHVIERLIRKAGDEGFETVYALTDQPDYLAQFGFQAIEREKLPPLLQERIGVKREETAPEAIPMRIAVDRFVMPDRLRERFKTAAEASEPEPEERPEDFGIDPDEATYKYDTG